MKQLNNYIFIFSLIGISLSCSKPNYVEPTVEWIRVYSSCFDEINGSVTPKDFIITRENEFFITGTFTSSEGIDSLFIIHADTTGKQKWLEKYDPNVHYPYPQRLQLNNSDNLVVLTNNVRSEESVDSASSQIIEIDPVTASEISSSILDASYFNSTDEYYFFRDFFIDANGMHWLAGTTTNVDTTKYSNPVFKEIDQNDVFVVQLDGSYSYLNSQTYGTRHSDFALTINELSNGIVVNSSNNEGRAEGSDLTNRRFFNNLNNFTNYVIGNDENLYPSKVAVIDTASWLTLYTPINALSERYQLLRFDNDTTTNELTLPNDARPMTIHKLSSSKFLLAGSQDGAGQIWLTRGNIGSSVLVKDDYGILKSNDYSTVFTKIQTNDGSSGFFYVLGTQTRPTATASCQGIILLRLKQPDF